MKKHQAPVTRQTLKLGDLICTLYEEAEKVSSDPREQRFLVYAALKDLLTNVVSTKHPLGLTA